MSASLNVNQTWLESHGVTSNSVACGNVLIIKISRLVASWRQNDRLTVDGHNCFYSPAKCYKLPWEHHLAISLFSNSLMMVTVYWVTNGHWLLCMASGEISSINWCLIEINVYWSKTCLDLFSFICSSKSAFLSRQELIMTEAMTLTTSTYIYNIAPP